MVFAPLLAIVPYAWMHGWRGLAGLGPWLVAHPGDGWPLAVLVAVFVVGFVRFRAGAALAAGARDPIRRPLAALKLATGLVMIGWLTLDWPQDGANVAGFFAAVFAYAVGLWCALTGGVRVILLSVPRRSALAAVQSDIDRQFFDWDE